MTSKNNDDVSDDYSDNANTIDDVSDNNTDHHVRNNENASNDV